MKRSVGAPKKSCRLAALFRQPGRTNERLDWPRPLDAPRSARPPPLPPHRVSGCSRPSVLRIPVLRRSRLRQLTAIVYAPPCLGSAPCSSGRKAISGTCSRRRLPEGWLPDMCASCWAPFRCQPQRPPITSPPPVWTAVRRVCSSSATAGNRRLGSMTSTTSFSAKKRRWRWCQAERLPSADRQHGGVDPFDRDALFGIRTCCQGCSPFRFPARAAPTKGPSGPSAPAAPPGAVFEEAQSCRWQLVSLLPLGGLDSARAVAR